MAAEKDQTIDKERSVNADTRSINEVKLMLDVNEKGAIAQTSKNCITILGMDPFLSGKIKYNELSHRINIDGSIPWDNSNKIREWKNIDESYILYYFETYYNMKCNDKILRAVEMIADKAKFNPFVDMITSVKWDGQNRIESLLPDYLGTEKSAYITECTKMLLLAVINRAIVPGVKFDYMLVLVGPQGIGKSTLFRKLCCNEEWYLENLKKVDDKKDAAENIQGKLIVEFNEMLAAKRDIEMVKGFITQTSDDYRPAYAKHSEKRARTCAFIGTTNNHDFLIDRTGNRRFLPVKCSVQPITKSLFVDDKKLREYFIQVWAEAFAIYQTGKYSLVLSKEMDEVANELRDECMIDDPEIGLIQTYLDNLSEDYVCSSMIAEECFNCDAKDRKVITRINHIMQNSVDGWEQSQNGQKHTFIKYGRQKYYKRSIDMENLPF